MTSSVPSRRLVPLSARQRKQVYMHSTIFDSGGPSTRSVYVPATQKVIHQRIKASERSPVRVDVRQLPRPVDVRVTQNAGHGVVLAPAPQTPRVGGGAGSPGSPGPAAVAQAATTPASAACPATPPPSCPIRGSRSAWQVAEYPSGVIRASPADGAIPQEFWRSSVTLRWDDPRLGLKSMRPQVDPQMEATVTKPASARSLHNLSSEVLGSTRMVKASTASASKEIRSCIPTSARLDSRLDWHPEGVAHEYAEAAWERRQNNLQASPRNIFRQYNHEEADGTAPVGSASRPPTPRQPNGARSPRSTHRSGEDSAAEERRRTERNFSDLFGTKMGGRRSRTETGRQEILATSDCSFLDSRTEIACRHLRRRARDKTGAESYQPSENGDANHETNGCRQTGSRRSLEPSPSAPPPLAGSPWSSPPPLSPEELRVRDEERGCWDTRGLFDSGAEVARQQRSGRCSPRGGPRSPRGGDGTPRSPCDMKRQNLSSDQMLCRISPASTPRRPDEAPWCSRSLPASPRVCTRDLRWSPSLDPSSPRARKMEMLASTIIF